MKKILIIEDDPAIRTGIKDYLSSQNFEVSESADGIDGYNSVIRINPDLILLDVNLPGMNGIDICLTLRKNGFDNPIIMITSLTENADKVVGLEVGADDYIIKPFNLRELLARIRANLRRTDKENSNKSEITSSSTSKLHRHLLAVMFTDMKDYSKKMNKNETQALKLLKYHNQVMSDTIIEFSGRVVEIIGDAFLASFESATDAVNCAAGIQNKFRLHNQKVPGKEKIKIRIGIHIGDMIEYEGKLKGDSLNIAARIQEVTEPESIYISESVYLAVKGKVESDFKNLGEQKFKNINNPVRIYEVIY